MFFPSVVLITLLAAAPPASTAADSAPPPAQPGSPVTNPPSNEGSKPAAAPAPAAAAEPSAADLAAIERSLTSDAATAAANATPPARAGETAASAPTAGPVSTVNPDLAVILDTALAAFSKDNPRQAGDHDPAKNGFTIQQLELALSKAVDPYFRFDGFVVFSHEGVEVEEAYATAVALPGSLQLRAGQFLTRFGRQNPTHPHAWDFVDQPFVFSQMFGGEGNRGAGAEISWLTPLPWYVELIGSVTDAAGEGTARSFWGATDGGVKRALDLQRTFALRQFFPLSDDLSLLWGLSQASGPNPTGYHNRSDLFGTDLYLKYRPLRAGSTTVVSLQAEAIARRRELPGDTLRDIGGYAQLFYRFAQRWAVAARGEYGSPIWNQDGNVTADYLEPLWLGHRHRETLALTFWPTEFSRLRLQGSRDATSGGDPTVWATMLALEVLAGAHGAHAF
jgi:hypothetical protein